MNNFFCDIMTIFHFSVTQCAACSFSMPADMLTDMFLAVFGITAIWPVVATCDSGVSS